MADEKDKPAEEEAEAKPSMMPKAMIVGFIALVMVVETVLFFFMVPSADDVAALAEKRLIEKVEASMEADGEEKTEEDEKSMEVQMGTFNLQFKPPGADRNHRVEFDLFGVVAEDGTEALETALMEKKGRLRDRLREEIRHASMNELNNETLIKRRIFATSSEVLGSNPPLLQNVGFNRFDVREE